MLLSIFSSLFEGPHDYKKYMNTISEIKSNYQCLLYAIKQDVYSDLYKFGRYDN